MGIGVDGHPHVSAGSTSSTVLPPAPSRGMERAFSPGAILFLTYWFPIGVRGQILGLFYLGVPIALIIGGPLSGLLLDIHPPGGASELAEHVSGGRIHGCPSGFFYLLVSR